jgi:hypothetical protein
MRGLIFIEKGDEGFDELQSTLKLFCFRNTLPSEYEITTNESVFKKYLFADTYDVVLAIMYSQPVYRFCQALVIDEKANIRKIYFIYQSLSNVAMAGWAGSDKTQIHDEVVSVNSFKKSYPLTIRGFLQKKIDYVMLRVIGKGYHKINLNEIIFLQGSGYNTFIYTTSNKALKVRLSQKTLKSFFPNDIVQVHKSYSINKNHSVSICGDKVVLKNGYHIPVNNTYNNAII